MYEKLKEHGYSYVNIDDGWQGVCDGKYNGIAALEKPQPQVIDACAKFGGENTHVERGASRAAEALYLRGLAALAEGKPEGAKELFARAPKDRPSLIWARAMADTP